MLVLSGLGISFVGVSGVERALSAAEGPQYIVALVLLIIGLMLGLSGAWLVIFLKRRLWVKLKETEMSIVKQISEWPDSWLLYLVLICILIII